MTEFEMYDIVLRKVGYKKLKGDFSDAFPVYSNYGTDISMQLDVDDNIVAWSHGRYVVGKTKEDFYNNHLSLFRQIKLIMLIDE